MATFCERVKWIMFQDMCALIVVRYDVMESSAECLGAEIIDCERLTLGADNGLGAN